MTSGDPADIQPGPNSVQLVPIDSLRIDDSPRRDGTSADHVRILAESGAELPPIVVHRPTMRVIDGAHRVLAARLRGRALVEVRYFDGSAEDAFVLGVRTNVRHGLPLSLADRKAAAERILGTHPQWSDRAIASIVRLSATTMAGIRERSAMISARLGTRVGRDGRTRPVDPALGRRHAGRLLRENPAATLREISAAAGISVNTARDVRNRLARGQDPVLASQQGEGRAAGERQVEAPEAPEAPEALEALETLPVPPNPGADAVLRVLRRDPSLRFAEKGRHLLRLLDSQALAETSWGELANSVPAHWAETVADLAAGCAQGWSEFAGELKNRELKNREVESA